MDPTTIKVALPPDLVARLREKPRGRGGYQSFVLKIVGRLTGSVLEVDSGLRERIEHFAYDFGSGGWQDLLRSLLQHIEAAERAS